MLTGAPFWNSLVASRALKILSFVRGWWHCHWGSARAGVAQAHTPEVSAAQDAMQLLGWCSHRWGKGLDRTCRKTDFDVSAGLSLRLEQGSMAWLWQCCTLPHFFSHLENSQGNSPFPEKLQSRCECTCVRVPALACAHTESLLPAWQDFLWVFKFSAPFLCVFKIQSCTS